MVLEEAIEYVLIKEKIMIDLKKPRLTETVTGSG
jgi:hypothetical protein